MEPDHEDHVRAQQQGLWGRWVNADRWWTNPLAWPAFGFLLTFGLLVVESERGTLPDSVHSIVALLILLVPPIGFVANVLSYPVNERYLRRLVLLYVSIMFLFADVYFVLIAAGLEPFRGIESAIAWVDWVNGGLFWGRVFETLVDCIHFSSVTITTLGYGDIHPVTWYSKLLADLEVFLGVAIVAVGLGRYFSHRGPAGGVA